MRGFVQNAGETEPGVLRKGMCPTMSVAGYSGEITVLYTASSSSMQKYS